MASSTMVAASAPAVRVGFTCATSALTVFADPPISVLGWLDSFC